MEKTVWERKQAKTIVTPKSVKHSDLMDKDLDVEWNANQLGKHNLDQRSSIYKVIYNAGTKNFTNIVFFLSNNYQNS